MWPIDDPTDTRASDAPEGEPYPWEEEEAEESFRRILSRETLPPEVLP